MGPDPSATDRLHSDDRWVPKRRNVARDYCTKFLCALSGAVTIGVFLKRTHFAQNPLADHPVYAASGTKDPLLYTLLAFSESD